MPTKAGSRRCRQDLTLLLLRECPATFGVIELSTVVHKTPRGLFGSAAHHGLEDYLYNIKQYVAFRDQPIYSGEPLGYQARLTEPTHIDPDKRPERFMQHEYCGFITSDEKSHMRCNMKRMCMKNIFAI